MDLPFSGPCPPVSSLPLLPGPFQAQAGPTRRQWRGTCAQRQLLTGCERRRCGQDSLLVSRGAKRATASEGRRTVQLEEEHPRI
eukprot:1243034-Rhodomonas_salina.1